MKTKDRIIQASQELFNECGVHTITTNHIAAHLGISPGNLYYHFRNKEDIIRSIFANYVEQMNASFIVPPENEMSIERIAEYAEQAVSLLWEYRFFYSGITDILQRDEALKEQYLEINQRQEEKDRAIFRALAAKGLIEIDEEDVSDLAEQLRFAGAFYVTFMTCKSSSTPDISVVYDAVVKMLMLFKPYATAQSKGDFTALIRNYRHKAQSEATQTD